MDEIASIIFMGCCIFIPMIISVIPERKIEVIKYVEKPVFIEKKQPVKVNPLLEEAVQCLISLGMKKLEAKKKVEDMFNNKQYSSIESFLLDVYKK